MNNRLKTRAIAAGVAVLSVGAMAACEPPGGPLPGPVPETPPPATVADPFPCSGDCHEPQR